jgi:tetratricopeptide (TPR) repeat protein
MNLGVALYPLQLDRGVDELRESIRLNPRSAAGHINLAIGLNEQSKLQNGQSMFPEIVAEYREAIRLEPESPLAHEGLALGLYRLGKLAAAVVEWREAIRLQPEGSKAHNNLAFALALPSNRPQADYDEALVHARKAVQLEPHSTYFATLALAEYRTGHWAESLAAGERSLAIQRGGEPSVWFVLALASWRKGDKDRAGQRFDEGVEWLTTHPSTDKDVEQLRQEAANLLGRASQRVPSPASEGTSAAGKAR